MNESERKLMQKIAKEVDDIKKRPWFKRLDAEEQSNALKKMIDPAPIPEGSELDIKSVSAGKTSLNEPIWVITTTFKATNIEKIQDNHIIQQELKEHITKICREHGILKMVIRFEEQAPIGGGGVAVPVAPQPLG